MTANEVKRALRKLANPEIAAHSQRFFKTGKGEYGEGDQFLGVRVPAIRRCVKKYRNLSIRGTLSLLKSKYHEERLFAVLLFAEKFRVGTAEDRKLIYDHYLANTRYVNGWDIADGSAHHIVGGYLYDRSRKPLYSLARSRDLWERRIAIMATLFFIKKGDYRDTLDISARLINDGEDLIHKASGWMLREVGNRDRDVERGFLKKHYKKMPRTMLRYAIEKFPEPRRQEYLKGLI